MHRIELNFNKSVRAFAAGSQLAAAAFGVLSLSAAGTASAASYTLITPYSGAGTSTGVLGLNDAGLMTGTIVSVAQPVIVLELAIFAANSGTTYFEDINNAGLISGEFVDAAGGSHAFKFDSTTDVFTDLAPPNVDSYDAFGVNNLGEIVITGVNGANYLYNPTGVPEANTWVLMLIGLGGVGLTLRRRAARSLTV